MSVTQDLWMAGGRSVRGAAHVRRNLPNQDSIACKGGGGQFVAAISDGHGAEAHYRSDIGARLAVDAAVEVLGWFLGEVGGAAQAQDLPQQIVASWRQAVIDHADAHPLRDDWVEAAEDRLLPYGATLVAVGGNAELLVLAQIGDGDVLLGYPDGAILRPLPEDADLVGEQTYSLCSADALARFRIALFPRDVARGLPDFAMLSTDGVSKSFADEKAFLDVGRHYRDAVRRDSLPAIVDRLDGWLADVSRRGSGDDVTLCLAARKPD